MAKFTWREITEIVVTLIVCVWIIYRVADSYDLLPKNLKLFEIIGDEYQDLKFELIQSTQSNSWFGQISSDVIDVIDNVEGYIAAKKKAYEDQEKVAKQCGENSIFRFFMSVGLDSAAEKRCIQGNLKLQDAVKDLNNSNTPANTTPNNTQSKTPANTQGNNQATTPAPAPANTQANTPSSAPVNPREDMMNQILNAQPKSTTP